MRLSFLMCAAILTAGPVLAEEMSFEDAKAKADQVEESLGSGEMSRLVEAQGRLAESAFPYCFSRTQKPPPNFTVVVEVDVEGRVTKSWLDKETAFGVCFRERMVQGFSFKTESRPFFTSFEYKNAY